MICTNLIGVTETNLIVVHHGQGQQIRDVVQIVQHLRLVGALLHHRDAVGAVLHGVQTLEGKRFCKPRVTAFETTWATAVTDNMWVIAAIALNKFAMLCCMVFKP